MAKAFEDEVVKLLLILIIHGSYLFIYKKY